VERPAEPASRHDANVPLPAPTPADELRVIAALHRIGADLGDPIEVVRSATDVTVNASGLSEERTRQLRSALAGIPRVSVRISPHATVNPGQQRSVTTRQVDGAAGAAVPTEWARRFASTAEFDAFVERVLNDSDVLMARVYALHHLAERFPPATEALLQAEDTDTLARIRKDHEHALWAQTTAIRDSLHRLIPTAPASAHEQIRPWQERAGRIFSSASEFDRLAGAVFAGVRDGPHEEANPGRLATALAHLEAEAAPEQ
jgi:hypothetical protein